MLGNITINGITGKTYFHWVAPPFLIFFTVYLTLALNFLSSPRNEIVQRVHIHKVFFGKYCMKATMERGKILYAKSNFKSVFISQMIHFEWNHFQSVYSAAICIYVTTYFMDDDANVQCALLLPQQGGCDLSVVTGLQNIL